MSKILVTGARGFIGKHLCKALRKKGHEVITYDIASGQDVKDSEGLLSVGSVDIVIHLASLCIIRHSVKKPKLTFYNNVWGIQNVLEYCRYYEVPRIIFTSTARVYGNYPVPRKEEDPLDSLNPYVASKIYAEELIKAYSNCYGLKYTIIRPSTVFGEGDKTDRIIPRFIKAALNNRRLTVFQKTKKSLDLTYIKDFIDAMLLMIEKEEAVNQIFNISGGTEAWIEEVADFIIKEVGRGKKKIVEKEFDFQPIRCCLDISKAGELLGYKPKFSWKEGIKRTIKW